MRDPATQNITEHLRRALDLSNSAFALGRELVKFPAGTTQHTVISLASALIEAQYYDDLKTLKYHLDLYLSEPRA